MIKIDNILYPTDFSDYAAHARPYAMQLAKNFRSKVTLLHVVRNQIYKMKYGYEIDIKSLDVTIQEAARTLLEDLEKMFTAEQVRTEKELVVGDPYLEIIAAARRCNSDLIVMATHGYGPVKHLLLGSTAERVVRYAPCPVLTVRHPEHEFIHP